MVPYIRGYRTQQLFSYDIMTLWIKLSQSPFLLGFSDNIYHESDISETPKFGLFFFLFWHVKNIKVDLMVNDKLATLSAQSVLKNIKYLSIALNNNGRHGLLSFLTFLHIAVLHNLVRGY